MIERKFVDEKLREFQIQEYVDESLKGVGQSHIKVQRTPLGEKIVIFASKPGLVVGRGGENIKKLTKALKKKFGLENPQIEISEVENINLDANIIAEMIASSLERFGSSKFKGVGHKTMENVMNGGALGVEILISGKIPGSRAKRWRFYQGYLKKCGDMAITGIRTSYKTANLKTGVIGIQVRIMPPDIELVDKIAFKKEDLAEKGEVEEITEDDKKESKDEKSETKKKDVEKSEEKKVKEKSKDKTIETGVSKTQKVKKIEKKKVEVSETNDVSDKPKKEVKKKDVEAEEVK
jgi:small subunit ribosomal protein S3